MATESVRRVTLADAPPQFDGAALQLRFFVDVDGRRESCAITVEALEDHFGARSPLEADLRDAFERGRAHRSRVRGRDGRRAGRGRAP